MRLVWGFFLALVLLCAGARFAASEASADSPVTIGYSEVGAHQFVVPAGISSIHVVAVGAPGGSDGLIAGGAGAIATADIAVSPGQALGVYVGGAGGAGSSSALGGFNGGGDSTEGAGGGGASDVRSGGSGDLGSRLIVAGGGGGGANALGGAQSRGTAGGSAGEGGVSALPKCEGGGAGTASSGVRKAKAAPGASMAGRARSERVATPLRLPAEAVVEASTVGERAVATSTKYPPSKPFFAAVAAVPAASARAPARPRPLSRTICLRR